MKILVLSCDKYEVCWKPFFVLLDRYYPHHPDTYLVTETKNCKYCKTINLDSNIWTHRFRYALTQIPDDQILVMLEDFFIRKPVDEVRINKIEFTKDIIAYNFELEYRTPALKLKEWDIQKNHQHYLNSCQPTIWNKNLLIERLNNSQNPQAWEATIVDSPYIHFINNQDYIIDIGYRHQPLDTGWGITRGKIANECLEFLKEEALADEIAQYFSPINSLQP